MERKGKNIVTRDAAEDNLQFECCSIKINISTYFECSLLLFCFEVNWIPEIWTKPLREISAVGKKISPINN